jgi:DNA-binding NarL/FixJ family response regulator
MGINIVVVDKAELVHAGIHKIVSMTPDITVTQKYHTLTEAHHHLEWQPRQVLIVGASAFTFHDMKTLFEQTPAARVIVMALEITADDIQQLTTIGVLGFIFKHEPLGSILIPAIQVVEHGSLYCSPQMRQIVKQGDPQVDCPLNDYQLQVLRMLANHLTAKEIAVALNVTPSAIYSILHRIRLALDVRSTAQILTEASKRGLIK